MLTAPPGLSDDALVRVLEEGWGLTVASIGYRAVGFGSHHWGVVDADGVRWFMTVDDLDTKRRCAGEPDAAAFDRLHAALATAMELRESGASFVIAPIPTGAGQPVARVGRQFGVALYPHVDGESYSFGDFSSPAHRRGVLELIVALHTMPTAAFARAMTDDFAVPHRNQLEATSQRNLFPRDSGPYATRVYRLLDENAAKVRGLLARYDGLVRTAEVVAGLTVPTHGEPHPGNTILTSTGWVLIDWDTLLRAPPERDLWSLDPGDGSVIDAYAGLTGTAPRPLVLELYRVRWDLADIAVYLHQFRRPHSGSLNDEKAWEVLCALIGGIPV